MFGDGWDILAFCGLTLTTVGNFIGVHRVYDKWLMECIFSHLGSHTLSHMRAHGNVCNYVTMY